MKRTKKRTARAVSTRRVSTARASRGTSEPARALVPVGEEITFGSLGLAELTFSAEEERTLSEPVPIAAVRVKPTSKGQVYLSHPDYTRWFNRAFGRTGWALRPVSPPMIQGRTVGMNFVLFVHGQPVAAAFGEQEYHESNKEQTYGDAIESTYASALRRCAKRLGVGLELWDKEFCDRFLREHCVRVKVIVNGDTRWCWRRRSDPPLYGEDAKPINRAPKDERPPTATGVIDAEQKRRLWAIARRRGRTDVEMIAYIRGLGYASSDDIEREVYSAVCADVEAAGPLPASRG